MVFFRDVKKGANATLNLEHLLEAGVAKKVEIEFPDAPEEGAADDMYKFKRWWIHYTPADDIAGPFKGGTFRIEFSMRKRDGCAAWPNDPPSMKFLDPIWHPNVQADTGLICHPYAYVSGGLHANGIFTPAITLQEIIPDVLQLITEEGVKNGLGDPLNHEAANQVNTDWAAYCKKAEAWTREHAIDRSGAIPRHRTVNPEE